MMKTTKFLMPLMVVLVCACGSGSKEIELKEKTVVTVAPDDGLYEPFARGAEVKKFPFQKTQLLTLNS